MRTRASRALVSLSVTGSLLLAACGGGGGGDREAAISVDNCGREVALDAPAQRAVAVNQPATELLLRLGLADRVVGVGLGDSVVLPDLVDDLARVDAFGVEFPSLEAVLAREPDLVYATFSYTFTGEGIAPHESFADVGVATYQSPSECGGQDAAQTDELTMDDLYDEIGEVATLFDVEQAGRDLVAELRQRATTAADGLDAAGVELAWWYSSTETPFFAGCCGAPGIMTRAVGAENAFEDLDQLWPETGWELVADRDPDVFVLADLERGNEGDTAAAKIAFLESHPVTSQMTAVRERRYVILPGTTMDPSIRNVDGVEQLATGLRALGYGV